MLEVERALLDANLLIGAFEHGEIEVVLLADVIIQHALVGAGLRRDAVDAGARQPMGGELGLGGLQDAQPHALRIALPFWDLLCLGQGVCPGVCGADVARAKGFENEAGPFFPSPLVRALRNYGGIIPESELIRDERPW